MNALKTLPAALVAALGVIIAQGADVMPPWLLVILAGGLAAAAVYATPPGPGLRTPKPGVHKGEGGWVSPPTYTGPVLSIIRCSDETATTGRLRVWITRHE